MAFLLRINLPSPIPMQPIDYNQSLVVSVLDRLIDEDPDSETDAPSDKLNFL